MTKLHAPKRAETKSNDARITRRRALAIPVYIGCLLAFTTDVILDVHLSFGLFYLPLVGTGAFFSNSRAPWRIALFASGLVAIGFFFPVINPDQPWSLINRGLSIAALFITAGLVTHARRIQDALAEQTRRAEAAERIKTRVFTTLTDELRRPLHGLIGLTGVMMADARGGQRVALGHVHTSTKRLMGTIDNLIDLTNIDEREIRRDPVHVDEILLEAGKAAQPVAEERQIRLTVDDDVSSVPPARGDAWAIRRIVDNLIANALKFSPPGSVVKVAAEPRASGIAVIVRDTGVGIPDSVLRQLANPTSQGSGLLGTGRGTGSGLPLSRRLATAMGAELMFDSELGAGTTVTLSLPA